MIKPTENQISRVQADGRYDDWGAGPGGSNPERRDILGPHQPLGGERFPADL